MCWRVHVRKEFEWVSDIDREFEPEIESALGHSKCDRGTGTVSSLQPVDVYQAGTYVRSRNGG